MRLGRHGAVDEPTEELPNLRAVLDGYELYENAALRSIARTDSGLSAWTSTRNPQHLVDALLEVRLLLAKAAKL